MEIAENTDGQVVPVSPFGHNGILAAQEADA